MLQQLDRRITNARLSRLLDFGPVHDPILLLPHLRDQRLAGQHRAAEPDLDIPERAVGLEDVLARDAERGQAVQDGDVEAALGRELGVDVQRVAVAHQTVQRREVGGHGFLDDGIGRARGRRVVGGRGAAVRRFLLPAEAAGAADEGDVFVVEDLFARAGVDGRHAATDQGCVALVHDFDQVRLGLQLARCGDRELLDFQVLFAVQKHALVVVWHDVLGFPGCFGEICRHDAERRENLEVVRVLVHEVEVFPVCAEGEVVQDDVSVVERVCRRGGLHGHRFLDFRNVLSIRAVFLR